MDFDQAYDALLEEHRRRRTGERKGRLHRGPHYAEKLFLQKVWWPLFGNLQDLHPEYEIYDWNRKSQFIDYAYLPSFGRFGLEIDGYQSHVKDMDRERFSYSLNRDTFLTGLGWRMLHFSFDDVQQRPEVCRMLLQLAIGPYLMKSDGLSSGLRPTEKDVLRLAWSLGRPIRPKDVSSHYDINFRTARNWLQALVGKELLRPLHRGQGAVRAYELAEGTMGMLL